MNDTIILVTTKGCEACNIMNNIIRQAINKSTFTHITLKVIDCLDKQYRTKLNRYLVHDYPTALFCRDNEVITKFIGTHTVDFMSDAIKYWFD